MFFSYKTRRFLARILPTLITVLILILVAVVCWLLWLQRFVVYTPDGVRFDFNLQPPSASGIIPQQPNKDQVNIEYPEDLPPATRPPENPGDGTTPDAPDDPVTPEAPLLSGYYFDAKTVQNDPEGVRQQLERMPAGTAVLIQMANFWGYRYYTSEYGTQISEENRTKMDNLLAWLAESDLHVMALMPAFRDYYYSADNSSSLSLKKENGYKWVDEDRCYWLNPAKEKVLTRLCNIMKELKSVGFDEVVFDDFTIPESEEIVFSGDRREAVYTAAETLVAACASADFTISFITEDYDFRLPEGNCRLYIENAEPSQVQDILAQIQTPNNRTQVVFFCSTFDNRFDGCSVLRPLALAP